MNIKLTPFSLSVPCDRLHEFFQVTS